MLEETPPRDDAWIGRPVRRREDERLLTGAATFAADVDLPGQLHLRIVRSSQAHARLRAVDAESARQHPGVRLVLTGGDLARLGRIPLEEAGYHEIYPNLESFTHPVLATDRVTYVGQPVAAVLAEDPYTAEDAAELVEVDYDPLPVLLDPTQALTTDIDLFDGLGNEGARIEKSYGDVDAAFARAAHVVRHEYAVGRHSGVPMETRNCVVDPDPGRDLLHIRGTVHVHDNMRILARMLGMPETSIRMHHVEIGGSFGVKGGVYPEYVVAAWAARKLRRPVKWTEDRHEHLIANAHAREQVHRIEVALDDEGAILALRDEIFHNHGAFFRQIEPLVSDITAGIVFGPYRVPAYSATLHAVFTNKTPLSAYRGPGRYESTFARERILDLAAEKTGLDRTEIRRRNLLRAADLPWAPGITMAHEPYHFDSGDVADHFDKALDAAGWTGWEAETRQLRAEGRKVGIGLGVLMDKAGLGLYETGSVEISPAGRVRVLTGASSVGQGVETVLAQIVAEHLGLHPDLVDVVHSDTELVPDGVGSWSSRSTVLAGGAARLAALAVVDKAKRLAGEMLEASVDDLEFSRGQVRVKGAETQLSLFQIAERWDPYSARLAGDSPGLRADAVYQNNVMNYPYGVTMAQIEVDPETGGHTLLRFFTTTEAGRAVNPLTTRGQIIGAAVQGIGGALYEEFTYEDDGQPTATSFMDYLLPGAHEMPDIGIFMTEDAPSPDNPFGAKGLGEVGIIAAGAAVASAIDDAVRDGRQTDRLPVRPEQLFSRCQETTKPQS
ncbi:xanthine dehydrogenase family protein molybdopterin-binding subunit [Amycolatopsis sp. NPDC059090]|uniref:xanthine dehydrogenase family protein molybdopterin-binding subunit n=1 Tax=unclassified Amycolatopsis TaxID=2618356 RepID=UPI00366B9712